MKKETQIDTSSYSDEALFEEIIKGQTRAFSILYDRYSPQLYGLALKILQNQTLAEDVIQDVFVNIWKKAKSFDRKRGTLAGWMVILCRNKCIDALRSRGSRRQKSAELDETVLEKISIDPAEDPLAKANAAEIKTTIRTAMEKLPDEQKTLIEMAYFKGFSQSEISAELNLPLGTVKTRMRLGMQKLRSSLSEKLKS